MPIISFFRTLFIVGIMAAAPALSAAPTWAGPKECQFIAPAEWQDSRVIWDGACAEGKANGQGVLRGYRQGASTRIFFGRMKQGELNLGVIEAEDGFIAGEFVDGVALPNPERNTAIQAFELASAAAKELGLRLKKRKNASSAAYYLHKSKELEQVMD
jgi:hypothetical protein